MSANENAPSPRPPILILLIHSPFLPVPLVLWDEPRGDRAIRCGIPRGTAALRTYVHYLACRVPQLLIPDTTSNRTIEERALVE